MAQLIKNLPAMQQTWVQFLGGKDPLEKKMATHSNILGWRIPWTEEPGRLQFMGSKELDTTERQTLAIVEDDKNKITMVSKLSEMKTSEYI